MRYSEHAGKPLIPSLQQFTQVSATAFQSQQEFKFPDLGQYTPPIHTLHQQSADFAFPEAKISYTRFVFHAF